MEYYKDNQKIQRNENEIYIDKTKQLIVYFLNICIFKLAY